MEHLLQLGQPVQVNIHPFLFLIMKNSNTVKIFIVIFVIVIVSLILFYLFENQNDAYHSHTPEPITLQCPLGTYVVTYSGDQGFITTVNRLDKNVTWFNYVLEPNKEGQIQISYKSNVLDYSIQNRIKILGISPHEFFKPVLSVLNKEIKITNTTSKDNANIFTYDVVFIDDYRTLVTYKIKSGSYKENYQITIPEACFPPFLLTVGTTPYQGTLPMIPPAGEEVK